MEGFFIVMVSMAGSGENAKEKVRKRRSIQEFMYGLVSTCPQRYIFVNSTFHNYVSTRLGVRRLICRRRR